MKTTLATILMLSVGFILTTTLHAEPECLQRNLQSAIDKHDQKALHSLFNFQGVDPKSKDKIEKIIKEVISWDNAKVRVEPFRGRRLEEFQQTKTALNGNPTADVLFEQTNTKKVYSMLAGQCDNGFLILSAAGKN